MSNELAARWRRGRFEARTRVDQGWGRVRMAFRPIVEASVAAGVAWAFAHWVFGHPTPFFAAVAAWTCLGFSPDRRFRTVAEMAVGVSLGVGLGDLVAHYIGRGPAQITAVLCAAALLARFVDRGAMVTAQAGVQAIVIVGVPTIAGGPMGRWIDALTGSAIALLVAALLPHDPRSRLRATGQSALRELAAILHLLATGVRAQKPDQVEEALVRARSSQPLIDDWFAALRAATESVRISPAMRRHATEVTRLAHVATYVDRAIRNARVVSRRAQAVVTAGPAAPELAEIADAIQALAEAADATAQTLGVGGELDRARRPTVAAAARLRPELSGADWQLQTLVLLMRSMAVDLLQAVGLTQAEAREVIPPMQAPHD